EGMTFVVNADAGPAFSRPPAQAIQAALPKAKVILVDEPEEWEPAWRQAADGRAIGIAGGDGSVNSAAEVAMANGLPLAVVPAGTLNHLARDLGIETVEDTIDAIHQGRAAALDVATIDGRVFLNTASFGSYVELVDTRQKLEDRIGKWPAVVVALVRVLRASKPIEVEIDGRPRSLWMIFIGNCRYHPKGFAPSWRERLDDGLLDVRMVDGTQPYARTRLLLAVLSGTLGRCRVYEHQLVKQLKVRSLDGSRLRLARDGETFEGSAEFTVSKLDRPLPIYVNL
ncbi:MAG TPA: diacylglycerol kinase family protein, partial [Actinomycetota bacterium]|nr:diacylglycerol kinase family protein [Actinomycetota bacterium]